MMELDITELFEEVVRKLPEGLEILYPNGKGGAKIVKSPRLNYIFGSSQYIKDILDEYSKSPGQSEKSSRWLHSLLQFMKIEVIQIIFLRQRFR